MRVPVLASTNPRALATRIFHSTRKANVKVQIFDPVTLYVSPLQNDLQSGLDAVGNPPRGLQLQAGIYDFLGYSGELWAICNQQIEIEVQWWLL